MVHEPLRVVLILRSRQDHCIAAGSRDSPNGLQSMRHGHPAIYETKRADTHPGPGRSPQEPCDPEA